MGFLLAFDEQDVRQAAARFRDAVANPPQWQLFVNDVCSQPLAQSWYRREGVVTMVANHVGAVELRADVLPGGSERDVAERLYLLSRGVMRKDLHETRMTVWFPNMSDDDAGYPISESEEYERLVVALFVSGQMPPELEALDGHADDAATNWVGPKTVRSLALLESEEGLLAGLAAAARAHFTHDWKSTRDILERAAENGWALYFYERGS
jgi:hypothetical protein